MAPQVGLVFGDHHEVEHGGTDGALAPRTSVVLGSGVRLDGADAHPPKNAHATATAVSSRAPTTIAMSATERSCLRKGLNPTP